MIDRNKTKKKIVGGQYTTLSDGIVVVKFTDNVNMKVPLSDGHKFDNYITMLRCWIKE